MSSPYAPADPDLVPDPESVPDPLVDDPALPEGDPDAEPEQE